MNYNEAKDKRTDEQYKEMVETGIKNQFKVLDRLKTELGIEYVSVKDEKFSTNGPDEYKPDAVVWFSDNIFAYPVEVKYSHKTPQIDFKKWQIDKLVKINGVVIYSTENEYSITKSSVIKERGIFVKNGFLNKEAYRVQWNDLMWKNYEN